MFPAQAWDELQQKLLNTTAPAPGLVGGSAPVAPPAGTPLIQPPAQTPRVAAAATVVISAAAAAAATAAAEAAAAAAVQIPERITVTLTPLDNTARDAVLTKLGFETANLNLIGVKSAKKISSVIRK